MDSLTSTIYTQNPLAVAITNDMSTETHCMICAPWTRYSFMVSKCPPAACFTLYLSFLSPFDLIMRTYLAVIMFAPSSSSTLNTERNVPLLMRSRVSACFDSIVLGQFASRSLRLIASASQQ